MRQYPGIIFMGTPEFAVEALSTLVAEKYDVRAVVTVADKPSGRGLKLTISPVKAFALEHNIPVLQPLNLNDPSFIAELQQYKADIFIVVAFRKLPEAVWSMPPKGCFNLHASLLPQYRGAAPINHVLLNGENTTGVTTFFLNAGIDTGKMIMQRQIDISPDETAGELHDRLMHLGASLVIETVQAIITNTLQTMEQPASENDLKKAPKIFREDCRVNWNRPALEIHNFIRGLSPYPGAFSILVSEDEQKEAKIIKSKLTGINTNLKPGIIVSDQKSILVSCKDQFVELLTIQPAGKKAMPVSDFLRGSKTKIISFITP